MLNWIRARSRRRLLSEPFPAGWEGFIERNLVHDRWLDGDEKRRLRELVRIFVAEKDWQGCGGLILCDEIRVAIAAQACLLILGFPDDEPYRQVHSILVYPSTVVPPERRIGAFEIVTAPIDAPRPILGEARIRGPVILVWDAVQRSARHPESGHNVVFHEFAHALDMLDGRADGTPPLATRAELRDWVEVCSQEYLALRAQKSRGEPGLLDAYGATNEAEFFAVATEEFFTRPIEMLDHHPELYGILKAFYRQDPAARVERASARR